ncbi:MAG TPA: hypothetical protein VKT82_22225 [Ktedonobacterales bacterium]|nr:hypothetical protein [Ktedonobacterales bacterium]
MDDSWSRLWNLMNQMRSDPQLYRWELLEILRRAKAQGIPVSLDQMRALAARYIIHEVPLLGEDFVPRFIASYLKDLKPESILDPWAGVGSLLAPLAETLKPSRAVGIIRRPTEYEIAQLLFEGVPVDWQLSDAFNNSLEDIVEAFDAIISCPPLGYPPGSFPLLTPENDDVVEIRDQQGHIRLLEASQLLKPGGIGFFIVSPSFIKPDNDQAVYANLARFGLFVDAVLSIAGKPFFPLTSLPGSLVIIRRGKPAHLFVGELTADPNASSTLLRNLKDRKEGKVPQLGALVEWQSFKTFQATAFQYELQGYSRTMGVSPIPLAQIATEINFTNPKVGAFPDQPNAVYLPLSGRSPALTSRADLQLKPQNYAQIVLDPAQADATYVANFFNTTVGQKLRESLASGASISKIAKSSLLTAQVPIPELATQIEVVRVESELTDRQTRLESLHRRLWDHPRRAKDITKALKQWDEGENAENWLESLPFPLASILWAYQADADIEHKVMYLFHFFEALAEYIAIVLLSAYAADRAFYRQVCAAWISPDEPLFQGNDLPASFGTWVELIRRLAATTRRLLQDKEHKQKCLELFGQADIPFIEMLADRKLSNTLDEVREYRNRWKGHGGVARRQEIQERLVLLEARLSEVRRIISDQHAAAKLLISGSMELDEGIFHHQAKLLMGTRTPFRTIKVDTLAPMESRKLYLLYEQQYRPIKLLPFIRLMESPKTEQSACYFYSRLVDGQRVRWVSYQFEGEPELDQPDVEVQAALELLSPKILNDDLTA